MDDDSQKSWWWRTRLLAVTAAVVGSGVCLVFLLLAPPLVTGPDNAAARLITMTLIVPVCILGLIFWTAECQRRIDRARGFFED